jgi:hypothetical protein
MSTLASVTAAVTSSDRLTGGVRRIADDGVPTS